MATVRFSINPQDNDHQIVQAAGAAVVTKNIELTVDIGALAAAGLSAPQIRLQTLMALTNLHNWIETSGKVLLPG